jgi:hypothetical protein
MNRIPITDEGQKSENPILEILSVTICHQLFQVEFRIKFVQTTSSIYLLLYNAVLYNFN